jgi:hypothetical protein
MPMEVKYRLDRARHGSKRYLWTMMIMQPECVNETIVASAEKELKRKKKELPLEGRLRLRSFEEGPCGQILHVGPFEGPMERSFDLLKEWLSAEGYAWEPDSHDIYLNDSRRTKPEKLRTLIRVGIRKEGEPARDFDDPFEPW